MAQRSTRRDRENQIMDTCVEHARLNWTRSANSHTGPRHVERRIHRPDTCQHPTTLRSLCRRFFLHRWGRPHMSMTTISPGLRVGTRTFDVEPEALAVNRPVDEPRRVDTVMAQCRQEGHGLPVWHLGLNALAAWRPSPERRHVGLGPRVSRPEGFHLPASRRTVREPLDSHRSHQANVFVPNAFQCTNSPGFSRASFLTKRLARVLWD